MLKDNPKKYFPIKPEDLVHRIVKYYYHGKVERKTRPEWLVNPLTNYNLELDIFLPKENLAFEINGFHHQTIYQINKDNIKKNLCGEKGIKLISINRISQIYSAIRTYLMPISQKKFIPHFIKHKINHAIDFYKKPERFNGSYFKRTRIKLWEEKGVLEQRKETNSIKRRMELKRKTGDD
jgi:hypothetical protein